MEKTLIRQNAQWNGKMFDHLCPRDIMDNLLKKKTMRHVQILTGVRRCGKSTVFKLLINDLLQSGVSGKSILVLNLDDPQFIPFWDDSSKLFGVIENAERLTGEKVKYLFLDEVQHLCDWEIFIKSAYDTEIFEKIYITGSNSQLLQNRFSALLSGRYFENEVRPFSVREVFRSQGITTLLDCYTQTPKVLRIMDNVLSTGCFPEIVLGDADEDIKQELLKSYFESIVQKDCIVYSGIRDTHLFFRLVSYLMQNMGSRFSIPAVGKALKSNENTVASYLNFLCDSYICVDVRNFSYSLKETSRSQHKCYFIDNGLVSANVFRYSPQSGSALENLVYNELRNKGYMNISFDNSKTECDFLAYKNVGVELKLVPVEAASRVEFLETAKVDIILANFTVTDERKEKVDFALPYMKVALGVVSPDSAIITDAEQLNGKTLIVVKGTTAESYFTENYPDVKLQKYDEYNEAYSALQDGRGDAFSTDNTEVLAWSMNNPGFTVGVESLGSTDAIAPAVTKGNETLLNWINDEITALADEQFFHADYDATLASVYGDNVDKDSLVVEGGVM